MAHRQTFQSRRRKEDRDGMTGRDAAGKRHRARRRLGGRVVRRGLPGNLRWVARLRRARTHACQQGRGGEPQQAEHEPTRAHDGQPGREYTGLCIAQARRTEESGTGLIQCKPIVI
ncbi:hypothetical protein [Chitiniphilus eburneus]|uniref:Uncharacterized protein n=1 Tax=Chitiniphilus eburneus TaxID=2571148 RepID=A0A4U0QBR9_9NEIS|nr:hypothetical protein [Chitiniphilus eburneus]TJZ78829.1 hypothetical protein FAZ21_00650 [Chitiniphilus eburneus]